jgi:RNA polymerase sigma factor (sigma-70 family)
VETFHSTKYIKESPGFEELEIMRPRQSTIDIFSTFLQFEADRFSDWVTDPKLRRSMQNCIEQLPQAQASENFWALYWHKRWKAQPTPWVEAHLSAYLQETCYWSTQRVIPRSASLPCNLSDYFQIAIAQVPKILKSCDPEQRATLKSYSQVAFGNIIRDALRQQQQIDLCNDWGLLLKLSRKRLQASLQRAGLTDQTTARYLLAWSCFEAGYVLSNSSGIRKIQRPNRATWDAIANLYNTQRQTQLNPPGDECTPETLEKWLLYCATQARSHLYPKVTSLNAPKPGQGTIEFLDELPDTATESLLAGMIEREEIQTRQTQKTQIHTVLTAALAQLDSQAETLMQLYYRQRLTQQQIAQQLEVKQYTVSRRLTKARESLLLALTRWSQDMLHIPATSNVVKHISTILEEWLQDYYSNLNHHASEETSL